MCLYFYFILFPFLFAFPFARGSPSCGRAADVAGWLRWGWGWGIRCIFVDKVEMGNLEIPCFAFSFASSPSQIWEEGGGGSCGRLQEARSR